MGDTMKNWEARAREMIANRPFGAEDVWLMLQLGREMAAHERGECYSELGGIEDSWRKRIVKARAEAADERAEEIAKACEQSVDNQQRASAGWSMEEAEWRQGLRQGASIARSTIQKPKTREQVLEEALREIDDFGKERTAAALASMKNPYEIARRALEWKP